MKKLLFMLVVLLAGLGLGGGAAMAAAMLLGPKSAESKAAAEAEVTPTFVDAGKVLAPLVFADGRLSGYVQFQIQLQVPEDKAEEVTARLPLLMHAINMRTFRTPMAAGPDGLLPNLEAFRKVVFDAAPEAFGKDIVRKVAVTQATPA
jgi:flagellar basal body-associated protein FliL